MAMDPRSKNALKFLAVFISIIVVINVLARCDFSPSEESKLEMELTFQVQDIIKAKALIPDSTDFQDYKVFKTDDGYTVTGSFETKNAYGTMIPHKYSAEFNKDKKLIKLDIY